MTSWDMTLFGFRTCFLLLLLPDLSASLEEVTGSVGDTLLLPCTYSAHKGTTSMCWGRGSCTSFLSWQCNNVIIRTDGRTVTQRESERYKLMGNIAQGDVSLTITGVQRADEGTYCCHMEISTIFNAHRKEIKVEITEVAEDVDVVPSSRPPTIVTDSPRPLLISPVGTMQTQKINCSQEAGSQSNWHVAVLPGIIKGVLILCLILSAVIMCSCVSVRARMSRK
ncbi:hepatitis A virus cellular receptor 1 homolog [Ascaphus truei]|uniref:hepatitis A virus cellular receptor 1 homolog n=1 Tax=Ascaphus truei TaxID=8439 RepID=UPI003F5A36D4